jgi:hypothetical protein
LCNRVLVIPLCSQLALADTVYNVPEAEIAALQNLYYGTDGDAWDWFGDKWNFTNPNPCADAWEGVTCSQNVSAGFLHVVELFLAEYGLAGSIPPTIGQLGQLKLLDAGWNALTSTVPDSIGHLTELTQLYLNNNLLTGAIPASVGQLTSLQLGDD